jgi:integral membrane sensor domain MASE1
MQTRQRSDSNSKIAGVLGGRTRHLLQRRGVRGLAVAVAVGLLLFLLPFAANQHGVPLAFGLLPVLLFGTVSLPRKVAPIRETNEVFLIKRPL